MSDRNISEPQRRWLSDELRDWQDAGIVSAEQAGRILGRYETAGEIRERRRDQSAFVLQALAALLVFLAVLLLIGYNWQALPRLAKLAAVFLVLAGTYGAGFHLRYRRRARLASEVVFFLGGLLFGAAIWLIAQIYHLDSHYPDGVWWWALGVLPFALLLDTLLGHVLLVALLGLWAGMEMIGFSDLSPWFMARWGFVPNGAYTLPLLALPGLFWAYRKNRPGAITLYAPLLAWWVILQPLAWRHPENTVWFIGLMGSIFLMVAESHVAGSRFAFPFRLWGVLLSIAVLIPLSYYGFNENVFHRGEKGPLGWIGLAVMLGVWAAVLAGVEYHRARAIVPGTPALGERNLFQRQWLPVSLAVFMASMALWTRYFIPSRGDSSLEVGWGGALLPTILANVAIVAFSLWLIRVGIREGRGRPFAGGVACFLLWAVLRYADLFGRWGGMLGAALMFFVCGAALFGMARYWRGRKEARHA
jgi:uncharacterized membrane protein